MNNTRALHNFLSINHKTIIWINKIIVITFVSLKNTLYQHKNVGFDIHYVITVTSFNNWILGHIFMVLMT